jgi:hypothetical protein
MVAHLKSHLSRQVVWPVAGLALGVLVALSPGKSAVSNKPLLFSVALRRAISFNQATLEIL